VYAVGQLGTILHGGRSGFTAETAASLTNLVAVWGSAPGDVYAVGEQGLVLHSPPASSPLPDGGADAAPDLASSALDLAGPSACGAATVTTLAGSSTAGNSDGSGGPTGTATFTTPLYLAFDGASTLYLTDSGSLAPRSYDLANNVAATLQAAMIPGASGITVDATAAMLYVASQSSHQILKLPIAGTPSLLSGGGQPGFMDGVSDAAQFNTPMGIRFASQIVYVADQMNHRVRRIDATGTATTLAGSSASGSADGVGTAATFTAPIDVAVDAAGNLYVADSGANNVRKIVLDGTTSTLAAIANPRGITVDTNGNVWVTTAQPSAIYLVPPAGAPSRIAGLSAADGFADGSGCAAQFAGLAGIAATQPGALVVADSGNHRLRRVTVSLP
jgi:sugar lactone lactonase YvrE